MIYPSRVEGTGASGNSVWISLRHVLNMDQSAVDYSPRLERTASDFGSLLSSKWDRSFQSLDEGSHHRRRIIASVCLHNRAALSATIPAPAEYRSAS